MRSTYRYRSFFWPALLVLFGIIALLVNTGQIPIERLGQLIDLWPLILIVVGIELILRRTVHGVVGDLAAALVVLLAIVGAASYVTLTPNPAATKFIDSSADLGNASAMTLSVNAGGASITVSDTAPSGLLYHAHIEYNGTAPTVRVDTESNTLEIDQRDRNNLSVFHARKFVLTLEISPTVTWAMKFNSGAATIKLSVPNAHVSSATFNTGAATVDVTLGTPAAAVPVQVNAGAVTVHLHRPSGVPVSAQVSGAGLSLTVDGHSYRGLGHISAGQDFGDSGYDLRVSGGSCAVTVDEAAPSD